jgi:hypothetical protein
MFRSVMAGLTGLVVMVGAAIAADKEIKGKVVKIDADGHKITISEDGKAVEYGVLARGAVVTVDGKESKEGLADKALMRGAEVTLTIPSGGRLVREIAVESRKAAADKAKPKDTPAAGEKPKLSTSEKPKPDTEKSQPKGTEAVVVKVDVAKMILTVKVNNRTMDLSIGEETKFIGPRGGDRGEGEKGLKDDVLAPGAEIRFVQGKGKTVEEVHLPVRKPQK